MQLFMSFVFCVCGYVHNQAHDNGVRLITTRGCGDIKNNDVKVEVEGKV